MGNRFYPEFDIKLRTDEVLLSTARQTDHGRRGGERGTTTRLQIGLTRRRTVLRRSLL